VGEAASNHRIQRVGLELLLQIGSELGRLLGQNIQNKMVGSLLRQWILPGFEDYNGDEEFLIPKGPALQKWFDWLMEYESDAFYLFDSVFY
jgi:hypothetical protein